MRRSSSAARGPVVSQPERSVSATASISSVADRRRLEAERGLASFRVLLDTGADEAYALRGAAARFSACSRLSPTAWIARPGPRRPGTAEAPARLAVDPDVPDPFDRAGLVDALDRARAHRAGSEEAAIAPPTWLERWRHPPDRLAERGVEREPVQVDPERGLARAPRRARRRAARRAR